MATKKTPSKPAPAAAPKSPVPKQKPVAAKQPGAVKKVVAAKEPVAAKKPVTAKKLAVGKKPTGAATTKPASPKNPSVAKVPAAKPESASPLVVGAKAPDFALPDETGTVRSLRDFAGKPLVLYFYPKDDTPGCTRQACAFQENLGGLTKAGVAVVGVSRDSAAAHVRFKKKYGLAFPLLVDADAAVHRAYGAFGMKTLYGRTSEGALRTTVLIDAKGKIKRVFEKVKVDGHVDEVRAALG